METLGAAVKRARLSKGLRGSDLGAAIGKDASYVSRLENDQMKEIPDPAVVAGLSRTLGIAEVHLLRLIGYLSEGQDEPPPAPSVEYGHVAEMLFRVKAKRSREAILEGMIRAWLEEDHEGYVVLPAPVSART